jgi:hypothetical protein
MRSTLLAGSPFYPVGTIVTNLFRPHFRHGIARAPFRYSPRGDWKRAEGDP